MAGRAGQDKAGAVLQRRTVLAAGAVGLLTPTHGLAQTATSPRPCAAVVVGISQYGSYIDLSYADNDARKIALKLEESLEFAGRVRVLKDRGATKEQIQSALNEAAAASRTRPLETFVFYFAGHGARQLPGVAHTGYLLPHDYEQGLYPTAGGGVANDSAIHAGWLAMRLSSIQARRTVVIVDACYSAVDSFGELFARSLQMSPLPTSGGSDGSRRAPGDVDARGLMRVDGPDGVTLLLSDTQVQNRMRSDGRRLVLMAASGADQTAAEVSRLQGGVFTSSLLGGIELLQASALQNERVALSLDAVYLALRQDFPGRAAQFGILQSPVVFPFPDRAALSEGVVLSLPGTRMPVDTRAHYQMNTRDVVVEVRHRGELLARGASPRFQLPSGRQLIEVFIPQTRYTQAMAVDAAPGDSQTLPMPLYGDLTVAAEWQNRPGLRPPAIEVTLDGQHLGRNHSAIRLANLLVGTHALRVTTAGGATLERSVEIRNDSPLTIRLAIRMADPEPKPDRDAALLQGG